MRVSASLEPVLWIEPGDRVRVRTVDVSFGVEAPVDPSTPRRKVLPEREELRDGPGVVGPIGVRGAEPGMTLAVQLEEIVPGSYGYTFHGGGFPPYGLAADLGVADVPATFTHWELDPVANVARVDFGAEVPIRPFLGTIGLAPAESSIVPGWPPRPTGGNMDCKELTAGSTVYLPVAAPGGLLSLGDGHAAQADGEPAGTAIECAMERVDLLVDLVSTGGTDHVYADTPGGLVTFGFDANLDEAARAALNRMLDLLAVRRRLTRSQALVIATAAVNLRVTQIVNGLAGVHCVLPSTVFTSE